MGKVNTETKRVIIVGGGGEKNGEDTVISQTYCGGRV
jgi:hypothetical protein